MLPSPVEVKVEVYSLGLKEHQLMGSMELSELSGVFCRVSSLIKPLGLL